MDYYSSYANFAQIVTATSSDVINHLKSVFARHGILEAVVSDNGLQYTAQELVKFADNQDFKHVTSSSRYRQINGKPERPVQTVSYKALLSCRATPLECGYSPSELPMGSSCLPRLLWCHQCSNLVGLNRNSCGINKRTSTDNRRERAGDSMWVEDVKTNGTVIRQADSHRSNLVRTPIKPGAVTFRI